MLAKPAPNTTRQTMQSFEQTWQQFRERCEDTLDNKLDAVEGVPSSLNEAMRYAALSNGKRLRGMLVYAAGEAFEAPAKALDVAAAAVEMVHAFSLVHDDLPAMDDDVLRRGQPTCHIAFDEATAILAGDALQLRAFDLLANDPDLTSSADRRLRMVGVLAAAVGVAGMTGGQALDMAATGSTLEVTQLESMHLLKTGALIRASCQIGGLVGNANEVELQSLDEYGKSIGLAFQIADDILDVTADSATLGKVSGADEKMQKCTYVSLMGLDAARREADTLYRKALESIQAMGDNQYFFERLAYFVVNRQY